MDGKPDRMGQWSAMGDKHSRAAYAPKEGLARAMIEAKDVHTGIIASILDIPGFDFVNFEWQGSAIAPLGIFGPGVKSIKIRPHIVGASLVSRDWVYRVLISGKVEKRAIYTWLSGFYHLAHYRSK